MGGVIYLIRHTSVDKQQGICYGQSDVRLSLDFKAEAEIIRLKLSGIKFDACYSSPLSRCSELSSFLGFSYSTDDRLKEMDFGKWELLPWTDIYDSSEGKIWFEDFLNYATPGGESFRALVDRIAEFLSDQIKTQKTVAIVTHAGPVRAILVALGLIGFDSAFDVKLAFGEVIKIENNCYNYITL